MGIVFRPDELVPVPAGIALCTVLLVVARAPWGNETPGTSSKSCFSWLEPWASVGFLYGPVYEVVVV